MVVGYSLLADGANIQHFLAELPAIQATAMNGNGKGIVAAPTDGLTTGFEWEYFNRLLVGATGWFIAGERGCNLYWSACRPEYSQHIYLPLVRA